MNALRTGLAVIFAGGLLSLPANAQEIPAKKLFGYVLKGSPTKANPYGFYTRGCLGGGEAIPINGPAWQAMRLSRNRNWGHPDLVAYIKNLALSVREKGEWPGLLVGDMSQPRGGPMLTGHRSHQIGLDADIWLTPMPERTLSAKEREDISAVSMVLGKVRLNTKVWTPGHVKLLRRAASHAQVGRIFVHPVIKRALCDATKDEPNRAAWQRKIRPWWGHQYHFHVRLRCPKGSIGCKDQPIVPTGDGCGKNLDDWFKLLTRPPRKVKKPVKKRKPRPPITLARLPAACKTVLEAGRATPLPGLRAASSLQKIPLPQRKPR